MGPYYDIATMQHLSTNPELHHRLERARLEHEQRTASSGGRGLSAVVVFCALIFLVPLVGA